MNTIPPHNVLPMVIETGPRGERAFDIYSLLLRSRIVYLGVPINASVANAIVAQLLYLSREDKKADIHLYINSPGGDVYSGLAIYDTIHSIPCEVATYSIGLTASFGTILLCSGTKGKRFALPNSTIHMHQVLSGTQGQATDIEIHAKEVLRLQDLLRHILATRTGQNYDKISRDTDRDFWLTADQALEYGIVDNILGKTTETDKIASAS